MISLYDLLDAANGQLYGEARAHLFNDLAFDSRLTTTGSLYAALPLTQGDRQGYLLEAVQNGATGLLCVEPPEFSTHDLTVILVRDVADALMRWSHFALGKSGVQVIGVAGRTGKTVTQEAIRQVLRVRFPDLEGQGGRGDYGALDIPFTLARLPVEQRVAVLMLNVEHAGEMGVLVGAVRPSIGVITHLTNDMPNALASVTSEALYPELSDRFGEGGLAEECAAFLEYLSPDGLAVLNYDDDEARRLAGRTRAHVATVGIDHFGADLMAQNIAYSLQRTTFDLHANNERRMECVTKLLGKHQLYAVLSALAVARYFEIDTDEALAALAAMPPLPGMMRPFEGMNGSLIIDDTDRAEPTSAYWSLEWLRAVTAARPDDTKPAWSVLAIGGLDGGEDKQGLRALGQQAASFVDVLVTEGAAGAAVGRAALDQGMPSRMVYTTYSVTEAASRVRAGVARKGLSAHDVVLVTGGAEARMELVTQALLARPEEAAFLPRPHLLGDAPAPPRPQQPSWIEIDLDALANNVRATKAMIADGVTLFAVVKADAYGHGAVACARTALHNGADYLAVANIAEAITLRDAGIAAPILMMSYVTPEQVRQAVRHALTVTVYDLELARLYDRAAREAGGTLRVHLKVDTGMGRLGVLASDAPAFFRTLARLRHLEVEGIYTHFSAADDDADYTASQVARFRETLERANAMGMSFRYVHTANSAGTLATPDNHFNAVRVGIALYGLSPGDGMPVPEHFRPVMRWKTVVAQVKTLPPDHAVGYGNTYRTMGEERIAVIPVGYADGFRRAPTDWGQVLVGGQFAPLVGRVGMEKSMINVTHIPGVAIGDEVVLLGEQGEQRITADEVARRLGTIGYEVVCSVMPRVMR